MEVLFLVWKCIAKSVSMQFKSIAANLFYYDENINELILNLEESLICY